MASQSNAAAIGLKPKQNADQGADPLAALSDRIARIEQVLASVLGDGDDDPDSDEQQADAAPGATIGEALSFPHSRRATTGDRAVQTNRAISRAWATHSAHPWRDG